MTDSSDAITPFLEELESSAPTPGGGAVAGLCGALAAALTHMVGSLTVGKKKYADAREDFERAMPDMQAARQRFSELMHEDATAFDAYMQAFRLPKETDSEKAARREAIRGATVEAAEVPLATLALCRDVLPLVRLAADRGNKNLVSDAGIAALLVTCAARAAAMNVDINLGGLKGEDNDRIAGRRDELLGPTLEEAEALASRVADELAP